MTKIVEGAISVKASILNKKRTIDCVCIGKDKKTKDFNFIRKICKTNNIELIEQSREELEKIAIGKTFGGVLAKVNDRVSDEFIDGDIFYIDGIEDPFNLGYCIRTLYALGFKNILLPAYNYQDSQLIKSSAGAYEMANIKFKEDTYKEIKDLKNNGYTVYSLKRGENSKDIFKTPFKDKALFMIGGEKRGIASSFNDLIDEDLYIPYGSDFRNSLSATSSVDVLASLLYRQRNYD